MDNGPETIQEHINKTADGKLQAEINAALKLLRPLVGGGAVPGLFYAYKQGEETKYALASGSEVLDLLSKAIKARLGQQYRKQETQQFMARITQMSQEFDDLVGFITNEQQEQ